MNKPGLIHPDMPGAIGAGFFPDTVTIQWYNDENEDAAGQPDPQWQNLANHVDIPASIAAMKGEEDEGGQTTVDVNRFQIALQGSYPQITEEMRAVDGGGKVYDIESAWTDSHGVVTYLAAQIVT